MTEEGQETPATDSGHSQVADDANDRSSRDVPMKGHSEISSDIQALLGDMQTSFKNFSESIFSTSRSSCVLSFFRAIRGTHRTYC